MQGVDPTIFRPVEGGREFFADRFVVFSGGKFELRKGQDLVIAAFKILQQRHEDVLLVTSWFNQWPATMRTMRASPYIRFELPSGTVEYRTLVEGVLAANGIDASRAIHLGLLQNSLMARVYRNSDVGLFPNRCEGVTNLVLMEYMACGGPAIDADLEEIVEKLEWAYQNREQLAELGARAAQDMTRFTWAATAQGFLELLQPR